MKKKMPVIMLTAILLAVFPAMPVFADGGKDHINLISSDWAVNEMTQADDMGIIPDSIRMADLTQSITREEFASVSLRVYQNMAQTTVSPYYPNPFNDTSNEDVLKAYGVGITNGTGGGMFSPYLNLTREQGATMLTRAYKKIVISEWTLENDEIYPLQVTNPRQFADHGEISTYALNSVSFMVSSNILNGVGDNRFDPKGTLTREQAIAIAVRMLENLDPSQRSEPDPDKPDTPKKSSVKGEASGTLSNGPFSVTFNGSGGTALIVADDDSLPEGVSMGSCYDLILDSKAPSDIKIDLKAQKGMSDVRLLMGLPYRNENGKEGFMWVPLDSSYSGDTVTASLNLSDYDGAVTQFNFAGPGSFEDSAFDYGRRKAAAEGAAEMGVKYAARICFQNVFIVTSGAGHFALAIPENRYNDDDHLVKGRLRVQDGQRLVEDLETLFSNYKAKYKKNTRSKWPIMVEQNFFPGTAGGYGAGLTQNGNVLYLDLTKLEDGYKDSGKYDASSRKMYHTMAHEMAHFIQWEYTNKTMRSLWFDEAMAVYYEDAEGDKAGVDHNSNPYGNAEEFTALRQYKGIVPSSTLLVTRGTAEEDGYGRKPLIEYLLSLDSEFLTKLLPEYTVTASSQMEGLITKHSGKSLSELARGYYDALVAKGSLDSLYTQPWELDKGKIETLGLNLEEYGIFSSQEFKGTGGEKHSFALPRYGVHFIDLRFPKLPANFDKFSVNLETEGTSAILFKLHGMDYSKTTVYRSWDKPLSDIPIDADHYMLMVINESDTEYSGGIFGSSAGISVDFHDMNAENQGKGMKFPTVPGEVPLTYTGEISRNWLKGGSVTKWEYETVPATAKVTPVPDEEGNIEKITVVLTSDGITRFESTMDYNSATGYFVDVNGEGSVQLERAKYVDRHDSGENTWSDPGEYYIPVSSAVTGIRIHVWGWSIMDGVFTGKGANS